MHIPVFEFVFILNADYQVNYCPLALRNLNITFVFSFELLLDLGKLMQQPVPESDHFMNTWTIADPSDWSKRLTWSVSFWKWSFQLNLGQSQWISVLVGFCWYLLLEYMPLLPDDLRNPAIFSPILAVS